MADVTEQSARLNTLMRFHQYGEALPFAYKYRLDLQLSFPRSAQVEKALRGVEEVIDILERYEHKWMRIGKAIWRLIVSGQTSAALESAAEDPTQPTPQQETEHTDDER